jgi:hypothetical protein
MQGKIGDPRRALYLASLVVLLLGLGSAVLVYLTAGNEAGGLAGYGEPGDLYQIRPEESKTYRHDLELYGGKWNLLADDFARWFAGLWYGRSLAYTLAFITLVLSAGIFSVARHLRPNPPPEARDDDRRHADD